MFLRKTLIFSGIMLLSTINTSLNQDSEKYFVHHPLSPLTVQEVDDYFFSLNNKESDVDIENSSKRRHINVSESNDLNSIILPLENDFDEVLLDIPYFLVNFDPYKLSGKYPEYYKYNSLDDYVDEHIEMDEQGYIKLLPSQLKKVIATDGLNGCFSFGIVFKGASRNQYAFLGHYPCSDVEYDKIINRLTKLIKNKVQDDRIISTQLVFLTLPDDEMDVDLEIIGNRGKTLSKCDKNFIKRLADLLKVKPTIVLYYERPEGYFDRDTKNDFKIVLSQEGSYWEYFGDNYVKHYFQ